MEVLVYLCVVIVIFVSLQRSREHVRIRGEWDDVKRGADRIVEMRRAKKENDGRSHGG